MTTTSRRPHITLLTAMLVAALGGCATATGDDPDRLTVFELPTCAVDQARLSGTVDGAKVEVPAARVVSRVFAEADWFAAGGFLDVELDTGDHITIAWDEPLHDGAAAAATGVLDSPDASYETCAHDGLSGLVQIDPATGSIHFELSGLQRDGLCDGAIAGGELTGCVGAAPRPLAE